MRSADVGSAPGESTKINGELAVESPNDPDKSNGGGSMYFLPNFATTNPTESAMGKNK